MKRKIIELGHNCMVMSLPIKWVKNNNLKKTDELIVNEENDRLIIILGNDKRLKKEVRLTLPIEEETAIRMLLIGAYRSGYDRIITQYLGDINLVNDIIDKNMVGFELVKNKDKQLIIESVAEPDYNNFENLMQKQFFMILEMIDNIEKEELKAFSYKVQKYDNFLKRCISKKIINIESETNFWQFLSQLTRVSRACYYFNKFIYEKKIKLAKKDFELIRESRDMLEMLQKAYLTRDLNILVNIHKQKKDLVHDKLLEKMRHEDPRTICFILQIVENIYYSTSSLAGIIENEHLQKEN
jgi:hypothetical protein